MMDKSQEEINRIWSEIDDEYSNDMEYSFEEWFFNSLCSTLNNNNTNVIKKRRQNNANINIKRTSTIIDP